MKITGPGSQRPRARNGAVAGTSPARTASIRVEHMDIEELHRVASQLFNGAAPALAKPHYLRLIEHNPLDADAHFAYGRLTRYSEDDTTLKALSLAAEHAQRLPRDQQIKLAYTLGKANQDLARYEDAFDSFAAGAHLQAQAEPYDWRSNFALMRDAAQTLSAQRLRKLAPPTTRGEFTPIFILGMPRSGSTLIEQILVSHPAVATAGEATYLQQAVQRHLIGSHSTLGRAVSHWNKASLEAAATDYQSHLGRRAQPGTTHVIDKLPGNFVLAGLLARLLPNAIIIHSVREAYACLWSCFSTLFGAQMRFTYDFDTLGAYYREYRRLMDHWHDVFDALNAPLHNVGYEALVRGGEAEICALLELVGLDAHTDCLAFYQTERPIRTASTVQVRQPLYTTSIDLWRKYAERLEAALGKYLRS